ncbi:MAG: DHHA1 domain-containing protein [Candidatus Nezhaarchaeota archaeon]|nr:DHHA1 domain-containing protein [Candidatus Nezhaarchaeota archaeon]MCX8141316.1 DHHA1 domain-containing protein [Candidatus Nezhaarchaeota archaeon]MDW8049582.1 DHHA1 domain-containing protein [Nitrososphaerota archaeon]
MSSIRCFFNVLWAKLTRRSVCLSHSSDVDGIVCAALFLRATKGKGLVVLAEPYEIKSRGSWTKVFKWDYVLDLPCPSRASVFIDHHETNKPTPTVNEAYYDPKAPSAASLAVKAFKLEDDQVARKLIELANECDTANIVSDEGWDLNDAVKGSPISERVKLAKLLSEMGIEALRLPEVQKWISRNRERRERTRQLADKIPIEDSVFIELDGENDISPRNLMITLERKGAKVTCVITPRNGKYKIHLGSREDSGIDCSKLASKIGGGGHRYAAGATVSDPYGALKLIAKKLKLRRLKVHKVKGAEVIGVKELRIRVRRRRRLSRGPETRD